MSDTHLRIVYLTILTILFSVIVTRIIIPINLFQCFISENFHSDNNSNEVVMPIDCEDSGKNSEKSGSEKDITEDIFFKEISSPDIKNDSSKAVNDYKLSKQEIICFGILVIPILSSM